MEVSYSPNRKLRIIESFVFNPIPFDSVEVFAVLDAEAEPVSCGRLVRHECRYIDYGAGLLDAFSEVKIFLDKKVWNDEDEFRNFLASNVTKYELRL